MYQGNFLLILFLILFTHYSLKKEKWISVKNEREKLLELIKSSKRNGVVLLSGDIHYSNFILF